MIKGHTHVVRTTADKLATELDSWLERPDDPEAAESTDYTLQHVGGRDWVIVLRHSHDSEDAVNTGDKEDWISTASEQAFSKLGLLAGEYKDKSGVGTDGVRRPSEIAGWVEDRDRTWIMWIARDGRPHCLWLERDESGGVVGDAVDFSSKLDERLGWKSLCVQTPPVEWKRVADGDTVWDGEAPWMVLRPQGFVLANGVEVVHVQLISLLEDGTKFVVRGGHEAAWTGPKLQKQDVQNLTAGVWRGIPWETYRGGS